VYCNNCGQDLEMDTDVCPNCGQPVIGQQYVAYPRQQLGKPKLQKPAVRVLSVILLVLLGVPTCLGGGCFLLVGGVQLTSGVQGLFVFAFGVVLMGVFMLLVRFYNWANGKEWPPKKQPK